MLDQIRAELNLTMAGSIREKQAWVPKEEGTSTSMFICHKQCKVPSARCAQQCKPQGRMLAENAAILHPTISTRITQDICPDPSQWAQGVP